MAKMIGIDLGTTNSCIAVVEGGSRSVIPNAEGQRTTPSVVAFYQSGGTAGGRACQAAGCDQRPRTVTSVKRADGQRDPRAHRRQVLYPQELSAVILQKLRADAEAYLRRACHRGGHHGARLLSTMPSARPPGRRAHCRAERAPHHQRADRRGAGLQAGQRPHPDRYGLRFRRRNLRCIADSHGDGIVQVLATCGDNFLGGDDFDERIVSWLADQCRAEHGVDLTGDRVAMQRLRGRPEKAKKGAFQRNADRDSSAVPDHNGGTGRTASADHADTCKI